MVNQNMPLTTVKDKLILSTTPHTVNKIKYFISIIVCVNGRCTCLSVRIIIKISTHFAFMITYKYWNWLVFLFKELLNSK